MSTTIKKPAESQAAADKAKAEKALAEKKKAEEEQKALQSLHTATLKLIHINHNGCNNAQIAWNIKGLKGKLRFRINSVWEYSPGDVTGAKEQDNRLYLGRLYYGEMATTLFLYLSLMESRWVKKYFNGNQTRLLPPLYVHNSSRPENAGWMLWENVPDLDDVWFKDFKLLMLGPDKDKNFRAQRIPEVFESIKFQAQLTKSNNETASKAKTLAPNQTQFFRRHISKELYDFINDIPRKTQAEENMVGQIVDNAVLVSLLKKNWKLEDILEGVKKGVSDGKGKSVMVSAPKTVADVRTKVGQLAFQRPSGEDEDEWRVPGAFGK